MTDAVGALDVCEVFVRAVGFSVGIVDLGT